VYTSLPLTETVQRCVRMMGDVETWLQTDGQKTFIYHEGNASGLTMWIMFLGTVSL